VTLVTGASRGIGRVIADDLARDGGVLVLAARDEDGLRQTAALVEARRAAAAVVACDVSLPEDRARLVAATLAHGGIDLLVNNAGIEVCLPVMDQTDADVEQQVRVNLMGPVQLTRAFLPHMIANGRGAVVMISSVSGKGPTPYNAIYAATKYAINGFTASLRIELEGSGVTAGVVCPAFVKGTGMWSDLHLAPPATMPEVEPAAVARAVRKVAAGAPEVIVTRSPMRPAFALAQLFPSLASSSLRRMGVLDVLKARADVVARRRRSGG
jgi:short-subunit dehydrogenase